MVLISTKEGGTVPLIVLISTKEEGTLPLIVLINPILKKGEHSL